MRFCELVLWFAFYSFGGWVFECVYYSLLDQKIVNSGFLRGPCCPVYGVGAVAVILALNPVQNPAAIFFLGILIAGSIEYFTGWLLEKLFHARWWDYRDMPFNIGGRVFPLSLLAFGVMSLVAMTWIQPWLTAAIAGLSDGTVGFLAGAVLGALLFDLLATVSRLKNSGARLAAFLNGRYQAALKVSKPLRGARAVMEKVIWGRPVTNHGGPTAEYERGEEQHGKTND